MGEYYRGFKYHNGSSEQQMPKTLPKLQTITKDSVPQDINEIVELYSIALCFEEFEKLPHIENSDKDIYRERCKEIPQICGRFCSMITDDTVVPCFQKINFNYRDELLSLFDKYGVFAHISNEKLVELIEMNYISLVRILSHKSIVTRYDKALTEYMRTHIKTAEFIISHLWEEESDIKNLPPSLSNEIALQIIDSYIELEDDEIHPNSLQLLENGFDTNGFRISDEIKLKAKKRRICYWENKSSGLHHFEYGYEIEYTSDLSADDPVKTNTVGNMMKLSYSKHWISENLDYPTILNNFIWLFGFVDSQYRCTFSPTSSKLSLTESLFGVHGKGYYPRSMQCSLEQGIAQGNLSSYYRELSRHNIRLEDVFEWFFNEYILNEFGVAHYHFEAPSEHTSLLEKCKLIALAIDEILKQFNLWCKHGVIERDLLETSSKPLPFSEIGSKQEKKYAYAQSDEIKQEMGMLFSESFPLGLCHDGKTFAELLSENSVNVTDFEDYDKENLDFLISRGVVTLDGNTLLPNKPRILLLKELFNKGVLCPNYLFSYQQQLFSLEENGDIVYESTLFSRPEQQLLNQKLNKAEFTNGDDLRNKYVHGSYPLEEAKQERDYFDFLVIIALIIIKINEEFLLADRESPKTT